MFKEEIQKIGDAIGLEGKFLVNYGIDQIIETFKAQKADNDRAVEMLRIAAKYIRANDPEGSIHYDEADCDGYCVADDCETAAEMICL